MLQRMSSSAENASRIERIFSGSVIFKSDMYLFLENCTMSPNVPGVVNFTIDYFISPERLKQILRKSRNLNVIFYG